MDACSAMKMDSSPRFNSFARRGKDARPVCRCSHVHGPHVGPKEVKDFLFYVYFFNELLLWLVSCFLLRVFYFRISFPIYMRIVEHFNQFWRLIKFPLWIWVFLSRLVSLCEVSWRHFFSCFGTLQSFYPNPFRICIDNDDDDVVKLSKSWQNKVKCIQSNK